VTDAVDAHAHVWERARGDYGWLNEASPALARDFGVDDLERALDAVEVRGVVLVQAAPTVTETRRLLDAAAKSSRIRGVVGWVDFASPSVAADLASLRTLKLVGLRPMIQDEPDPEWMLRRDLAPAWNALAVENLAFDALVRPRHLAALCELAARRPELRLVLNHAGKPDVARWRPGDPEFSAWRRSLDLLAASPTTICKISGWASEAGGRRDVERYRPYFDAVREAFGARRMLWGGDWPVVEAAGGLVDWRRAVDALAADWGDDERRALFGGNAERVYRLQAPGRERTDTGEGT
jgi:L-fuconolactonase